MATSSPSASTIRTSTIVAISVGTVISGLIGYAVYFDHKRRTDPEFRKALKRESKKQAKVAKQEEEAQGEEQKKLIKVLVQDAKDEGFPEEQQEMEEYFMKMVARGEGLAADGSDPVEAALCFYKALKVYPQKRELMNIYDKTVPKALLDILADMVAYDEDISVGGAGSDSGSVFNVE